ncbi:MAG TPA: YciC family protein [Solirubrobacteraceae bacterium]|nr:YciC family protein [Solirubrobacteraceae bacterium]
MTDRLDVGAVIRRVFDIYVDQYSVLLPASAVVFVITGIVSALLVAAAPGLALIALLLSLIAGTLFTGMVVELVSDVQDGRRDHSAGELLRAATPVLGQLILVGIVAGIGILIGFFLIIVPGLILLTIWSVAAPVVVLERPGVFAALSRSRELVRGNGWQVFGVIFVLFVLVIIVSSAIQIGAESAGTGAGIVARVILGILTGPISGLAAAVLYFDLRAASGERVGEDRPLAPNPPPIS